MSADTKSSFTLPGFNISPYFNEQVVTFFYEPEVRIHINAPSESTFDTGKDVGIVLFALPNGNTIEHTVGKVLEPGDDWHYDIQHIGAQTRFLREQVTDYNLVTVYLEAEQLSWPAWKAAHSDHAQIIKKMVEYIKSLFADYNPFIVLSGHSGGGRFTFSFMDAFSEIPDYIDRISFLDSNYGYEHTYGAKFVGWLNSSTDHYISVIAYNDSVALYNGAPIVSPTGGTWYRSRIMKNYLADYFTFTDEEDDDFIRYTALNGRVKFILKKNPTQAILHTIQVEKNGFIQGMVSGTDDEGVGYTYYSDRAYSQWIQTNIEYPEPLTIPPRSPDAKTGSEFMQFVTNMSFEDREVEIFNEISTGNIPNFIRDLKEIEVSFNDLNGSSHTIKYEVMPIYLAIGSDEDFCRVPMGPITAQRIADLFGAVMPTRKLVDNIYINAETKLAPVTYTPVGNQNELVPKFIEHNSAIEQQRIAAGGLLGQLTGGTKKDVVLSNKIIDPSRPNHVTIYGWHWLSGTPIQPLTNIHIDTYVDYSHGIRFLNRDFLMDGEVRSMTDILTDPILYKVLSDESGVMIQPTYISSGSLAPRDQKSFGIISEEENQIKIIIETSPAVESYLVYPSTDGITFMPPLTFNTNVITISGLPSNSLYFIKIKAVNTFGSSADSELLSIVTSDASNAKGLIVNGFDRTSEGNTFNFVRQHSTALVNSSISFESATNDAVVAGLVDLADYDFVDYILGDESTVDETFSDDEQEIIKSYLRGGGKLFVSGSEIAWDLDFKGSSSDKDFIWNFLKMRYINDAPGGSSNTYYQAVGMSGTVFDGITSFNFDNGTHGTINVDWPDVVKGTAGGTECLRYVGIDTNYAGVSFSGMFPGGSNMGKVITLGIPFETIVNESVRNNLMQKVVTFFETPTDIGDSDFALQPSEFKLYQNYPNPFNPTTKIKYSIPNFVNSTEERNLRDYSSSSNPRNDNYFVQLKIFDILGREIETLVSEVKTPGAYEIIFDGSKISSGVYFYTLMAEDFSETKKLVLLK
jgi:hypothetical protein